MGTDHPDRAVNAWRAIGKEGQGWWRGREASGQQSGQHLPLKPGREDSKGEGRDVRGGMRK